mgnify:CR=1 FL=1
MAIRTSEEDRIKKRLKAEWESPDGFGTPDFDEDSHNLKRDSRTIRFIAEYCENVSLLDSHPRGLLLFSLLFSDWNCQGRRNFSTL